MTTTLDLYIGFVDGGSGELEISGGTVTVKRLHVGYALDNAGTATLDIQDDSAVIKVGEKLRFGKRSRLVITNGQDPTITMTESDASFEIDEDATAGNLDLDEMKLVFECEDNSDRKRLEVAGEEDEGLPDSADFNSDNFLLKELVVGKDGASGTYGPVTLQLVDDEDNQDDESDEALYVDTLTIKAGGTFARVNGESWSVGQPDYDLYYKNAGDPKKFWMGDATLDGSVGQGDLNAVLGNWGQSGKVWGTGDLNGDRFVGQNDLNLVLANWGAGGEGKGGGKGDDGLSVKITPVDNSCTKDLASYVTQDIVATTGSDWLSCQLVVTLEKKGQVYQHARGGVVSPDPALFKEFPALEFDTYVSNVVDGVLVPEE